MRILIIGASSYIGAGLQRDLSSQFEVIGTYSSNKVLDNQIQLNIRNSIDCRNLIKDVRPQVIIHCANNANAKWCEAHPQDALELNVQATQLLSSYAEEANAKWVYISSLAAMHQNSSLYAKTKYDSEQISMKVASWLIFRPSLTMGLSPNTDNDRPFNRILKNITLKTPAVYDDTWSLQPTYIKHLSAVIGESLSRKLDKMILPVACKELCNRLGLAKDLLLDFGIKPTSANTKDDSPALTCNLDILSELKLPQLSYANMIISIKQELNAYRI